MSKAGRAKNTEIEKAIDAMAERLLTNVYTWWKGVSAAELPPELFIAACELAVLKMKTRRLIKDLPGPVIDAIKPEVLTGNADRVG